MNHSFTPSQINQNLCAKCKYDFTAHGKNALCEACGRTSEVEIYIDMLFCAECIEKEKIAQAELKSTENERVDELEKRNTLRQMQDIDYTIQVQEDFHNAKIASIIELKKAIDEDSTIENKSFSLARVLEERFKILSKAKEQKRLEIKEHEIEQRAIQTYYNDLAKKLKDDEREKIKLQDVIYNPPDKKVKAPKAPTIKKYDKSAVREAAAQSGIAEQLIQMTCVARQVTPVDAVRILRESGLK